MFPFLTYGTRTHTKGRSNLSSVEEITPILFTKQELSNFRRGFSHPVGDKLLNIINLAGPDEMNYETFKVLEEVSKHCLDYQCYGSSPRKFKSATLIEDAHVFGDEISIDIMFLDGKVLLHVVDLATLFSPATLIDSHGERMDN